MGANREDDRAIFCEFESQFHGLQLLNLSVPIAEDI